MFLEMKNYRDTPLWDFQMIKNTLKQVSQECLKSSSILKAGGLFL